MLEPRTQSLLVSLADLCVHEGLQGDQDKHEGEEGRCRQHVQSSGPDAPVQQSLLHAVQQPHGGTWHLHK